MKKQLTEKDREALRKNIRKLIENNNMIMYCFANKESNSGLLTNERLILMNHAQKSVRYYSTVPDTVPFENIAAVPEGKTKIRPSKCEMLKGKTSTVITQWEENKKSNSWIFSFSTSKMANQWVAAVQDTIAGKPYSEPSLHNSKAQLNPVNQVPKPPGTGSAITLQPAPGLNNNMTMSNPNIKQLGAPSAPVLATTANVGILEGPAVPPKSIAQPIPPPITASKVSPVQPPTAATTAPVLVAPNEPQFILSEPKVAPTQPALIAPKPIDALQSKPTSNPQFGDVAEEIKALRKNNYNKFNLTNELSQKNLHAVEQQPLQLKDHIETKRSVYNQVQSQKQPEGPMKKKIEEPPIVQVEPAPRATTNNSGARLVNQNSKPMFESGAEPARSNVREMNITTKEQQKIYNKMKEDHEMRKVPSKSPLTSIKSPAQMSQFYNDDEEAQSYARQMHRVHSQQPNVGASKQDRSRIKSQIGYEAKNSAQVLQPKKPKSFKKWNELWCTGSDPVPIYEDFIKICQQTSIEIIDELPFPKANREYIPLKYESPYFMYNVEGITYSMHYYADQSELMDTSRDQDERAPILYDHESYTEAKREFYNYNLVLGVTGNRGLFKVPLACYVEYKGVLIFCRAAMPEGFDKVPPQQYEAQLEELEQTLRMRFIFNSLCLYAHPQRKYLIISELDELIPRMPVETHPPVYYRKQFLLENSIMIDDQHSLARVNQAYIAENIKAFVARFESLEGWVINSEDFVRQAHRAGISLGSLANLYEETTFVYFRKVIISEMVKGVACDILRSELNSAYATFPVRQFEELSVDLIDKIVLDCAHELLNQLFSYSSRSENIWRSIVKEVNKRYRVIISKEDIIPGYLLGGIAGCMGIDCDFKTPSLNRKESFFIRQNTIPRDLLFNFYARVRRYDLDTVSPLVGRVKEILSAEPSPDHFEELVRSLDLKESTIPSYLETMKPEIITYMCNFVPLGEHEEFDHIGIYNMLEAEPHTYCSTKISLLAIKWAAKKKNQELAHKIFEIKFEENSFWVSEFNPAISEYYDFFSLYNVASRNYEQGIKLAKSSLVNSIKLTGANSLPVADKHYQLGNIFFKVGRKEEALKEYLKTKQILDTHRQTGIPEYGVILLKLALLYLNFGKISDSVGSSLEALKIFDANGNNEQQEIETYEILARSYEITRKSGDLSSVGALCAQKFNRTDSPKIFERMAKIVLFPKLVAINSQDAKTLLKLLNKLQQLQSPISYNDAFNYLQSRAQQQVVMKKVLGFIENICNLYEDTMRKDLLRRHKSLSHEAKNEASEMLVTLEAVAAMVGYSFLTGALRECSY